MTDYLALAMEQEEQQEEEWGLSAPLTEGAAVERAALRAGKARPQEGLSQAAGEVAGVGPEGSFPPAEEGALDRPWEGKEVLPPLKEAPEGGLFSPLYGLPFAMDEGQGPRPLPFGDLPGSALRGQADVLGFLRSAGSGRAVPAETGPSVLPLLRRLRQTQQGAGFAQRERRAFTVTLPGGEDAGPAWSAEELDRAVERDARRYGGGFGLY